MSTHEHLKTLDLMTHMSRPMEAALERQADSAMHLVLAKASLHDTLSRLPPDAFRERALAVNKTALAELLDWYCGTVPRFPWKPPVINSPFGPFSPHIASLAIRLHETAQSLADGPMKSELARVTAELMGKAQSLGGQRE